MFARKPALFALVPALLFAAALAVATPAEAVGKLNVNTAAAADLAKVPGLDTQIAVRIVARRAAKPFKSLDELLEVQGISKLTMISAAEYLEAAPVAPPPAAVPAAASGKKLDLNKATFSELLLLPEMTPRTAKAIVDYRERNHGFKTVDELAQVPGIEKRAMITLYDRLTVKAPTGGDSGEIVLGDDGWTGTASTAVARADTPTPAPAATPALRALSPGEKIDINTASRGELERLPDIGPVMAQRILDYRKSEGAFDTIEELLDVRGIGQNRLTSLRPWVTVGGGSHISEVRPTPERPAATPKATPVRTAVAVSTPRPVPTEKPEPTPAPTKVAMAKPSITPDGRVNINVAGVDELLTLPRMTKEIAQEIVEYRTKNGPFRDPHAIVDVPSIGEAAYARMRDKIAAE